MDLQSGRVHLELDDACDLDSLLSSLGTWPHHVLERAPEAPYTLEIFVEEGTEADAATALGRYEGVARAYQPTLAQAGVAGWLNGSAHPDNETHEYGA